MADDLTDNLCVLQDYLDDMLDRVQENTLSYQRFQKFELELFAAESLQEIIDITLLQGKEYFDLDFITICLLDKRHFFSNLITGRGFDRKRSEVILLKNDVLLTKAFGHKQQLYLGPFKTEKCTDFFPTSEKKPTSVALLPLIRHGKYLGSLNLGSFSSEHFETPGASEFSQHLCAVVSICLENQINYELSR